MKQLSPLQMLRTKVPFSAMQIPNTPRKPGILSKEASKQTHFTIWPFFHPSHFLLNAHVLSVESKFLFIRSLQSSGNKPCAQMAIKQDYL